MSRARIISSTIPSTNYDKKDTKIEGKMIPRIILWRINPKECSYSLMNRGDEIFMSAASAVKNYHLDVGDILLVVGSGKNSGLVHGIWQVNSQQTKGFIAPIPLCWTLAARGKRAKEQYYIHARCICDFTNQNRDEVWQHLPPGIIKRQYPTIVEPAYRASAYHFMTTWR